jgi:hypothetical protein
MLSGRMSMVVETCGGGGSSPYDGQEVKKKEETRDQL